MKTGQVLSLSEHLCVLRVTQGRFIERLLGERQWGLQGATSAQRHIQGMWRHQRDPGVEQDLRDLVREIVRGRVRGGEGREQGRATG